MDTDKDSNESDFERILQKLANLPPAEVARLQSCYQTFNHSGFVVEVALRAFVLAAVGAAAGLVFLGDAVRGAGLKIAGVTSTIWFVAGCVRFAAYRQLTGVVEKDKI